MKPSTAGTCAESSSKVASPPAGNDNAAGRGRKAKTPLSEQGDVKEEGIDLLVMPDD